MRLAVDGDLTASPTSDGSFSAAWTATIASKDAFFSIFFLSVDASKKSLENGKIRKKFREIYNVFFALFSNWDPKLLHFWISLESEMEKNVKAKKHNEKPSIKSRRKNLFEAWTGQKTPLRQTNKRQGLLS